MRVFKALALVAGLAVVSCGGEGDESIPDVREGSKVSLAQYALAPSASTLAEAETSKSLDLSSFPRSSVSSDTELAEQMQSKIGTLAKSERMYGLGSADLAARKLAALSYLKATRDDAQD